jgi:large-conductance mechanosensitive channel
MGEKVWPVKLVVSIVLAMILGLVLIMLGPFVGGVIAFGVVAGGLFRGIYLLNNISKRLDHVVPKSDKVKEAYLNYLHEKKELPDHLKDKDAYLQYVKEKESHTPN